MKGQYFCIEMLFNCTVTVNLSLIEILGFHSSDNLDCYLLGNDTK
jgi:hypothetical protein